MKKPYNIYCFMLLFTGNKCYFYRCAAHSKPQAYQKMLTELTHDTNMLRDYNINVVRLIHVITCSDSNKKFLQGLKIAAYKYRNFVQKYHYGMLQQFYYLNTQCTYYEYGNKCQNPNTKYKRCCMNSGIYCKDYCKVGEFK